MQDASTGTPLSANSSALKMFGAKDEREFLSRRPWDFSPRTSAGWAPVCEKAPELYETALREGTYLFEWVHMRTDRTEFYTDLLLTKGRARR